MRLLRLCSFALIASPIGCGSDVVADPQATGATGAAGGAGGGAGADPCPGSAFEIQEGAPCALASTIETCSFADPDCPGATLIYSCPAEGTWALEIEWDVPNCNSPETCPVEVQQVGGACDVKSFVECTYPSADCESGQVELSCVDAVWQLASDCPRG